MANYGTAAQSQLSTASSQDAMVNGEQKFQEKHFVL